MSSLYVHIHAPKPVCESKRRLKCPFCKRRTTFAIKFYEWYGALVECGRCEAQWSDGELSRKPRRKAK